PRTPTGPDARYTDGLRRRVSARLAGRWLWCSVEVLLREVSSDWALGRRRWSSRRGRRLVGSFIIRGVNLLGNDLDEILCLSWFQYGVIGQRFCCIIELIVSHHGFNLVTNPWRQLL